MCTNNWKQFFNYLNISFIAVFCLGWTVLFSAQNTRLVNSLLQAPEFPTQYTWQHVPRSEETARLLLTRACVIDDTKTASEIMSSAKAAAERYNVSLEVLFAVMSSESGCNLKAKSSKGAIGLMQLMPETAKSLGLKRPHAVRENIFGGARYLSVLLKQFNGNLQLALAAYNSGPNVVRKYGKIPPYPETIHYVHGVLKVYHRLNKVKPVEIPA